MLQKIVNNKVFKILDMLILFLLGLRFIITPDSINNKMIILTGIIFILGTFNKSIDLINKNI